MIVHQYSKPSQIRINWEKGHSVWAITGVMEKKIRVTRSYALSSFILFFPIRKLQATETTPII